MVRRSAWLAVVGVLGGGLGLVAPGVAVAAPDPAMPSIVEDFGYPGSGAIEQEQGIRLVRGDGRITLAACGTTDVIIVETLDRGQVCFRVQGATGFLGVEIQSVYFIRGGDEKVTAKVTLEETTQEFEVDPGEWQSVVTPEGEMSVLLELRAGTLPDPLASGSGAPAGPYPYVAKIDVAGGAPHGRSCTGALVDRQWVITTTACFAAEGQPVTLGAPRQRVTATLGRPNLATTAGRVVPVVRLVPHPDRNVVLGRLATPITDITPVSLATAAPATGEALRLAGYGRTATEWVPSSLHTIAYDVAVVDPATIDLAAQSDPCKGDSGAPALREGTNGPQLAAVAYVSWQHGCVGEAETRSGSAAVRVDDIAGWIRQQVADVSVFGAMADGRLTYTAIDSGSGDRLGRVTSTGTLGFTPKALATLNFNTLLVSSTGDHLFRVDIVSTNPLVFNTAVDLGQGWSHELLSYDGDGSLYGTAGGVLRRYTVTSAKPTAANITNYTTMGTGFSLRAMTTVGPDWLLATNSAGMLISYDVRIPQLWVRYDLAPSGWTQTHLLSPGNGVYYARTAAGGLQRYKDAAPFNGSATDLQSFPNDPVDTAGWDQTLLSAQPFTS